jgi:hypothetical protein
MWAGEWLQNARKKMDDVNYLHLVSQEEAVQMLWRALIDPETGLPIALTPDELRSMCTREEIAYLVAQYNDWHQQMSPLSSPQIGDEEAAAWIEELKKAPEETDLGGLDAASMRLLLKRMAPLLRD